MVLSSARQIPEALRLMEHAILRVEGTGVTGQLSAFYNDITNYITPHIVKDESAYTNASEQELKEAERIRVGLEVRKDGNHSIVADAQ